MKKPGLFIISLLLYLSCFHKQEHEILAPKMPVYTLSGRLVSSLDATPVKDALVTFYGGVGDAFISMEHVTDSSGVFAFSQVPGGYAYQLAVEKEGYQIYSTTWNVDYQDKETGDVVINKWLVEETTFDFNAYLFVGITRAKSSLWLLTSNNEILQLNADMSVQMSGSLRNIYPAGLAFDGENFWSADSVNHKLVKFEIQNDGTPTILEQLLLPDNPYKPSQYLNLRDIYWHGNNILACVSQIGKKYIRFDPYNSENPSLIDSPEPIYQPVAITGSDSTLYLQCRYYQDIRLYLLDQNYVNRGYVVIPEMNGQIIAEDNILWFARKNYIKKFILPE